MCVWKGTTEVVGECGELHDRFPLVVGLARGNIDIEE